MHLILPLLVVLNLLFFTFKGFAQNQENSTPIDSLPNDSLLQARKDSIEAATNRIPIFSTTAGDIDSDLESQDISGLLQSSRDAFTQIAGFNFGNARYRIRGYSINHTVVMINGVRMNDLQSGMATWSSWAGLNDVTRFRDVGAGIHHSPLIFGDVGGYSNIDTHASKVRKGTRASYAINNRAYRNRIMLTHATGLMSNGWAFAVSYSRRWAEEGYVEGTYFDAHSYFLTAEKRINSNHTLNFTVFGAPIEQGRQGMSVQEANDLAGTNFYNPFWGYQNGVKRNARVSRNHRPTGLITHDWRISDRTKLSTTALFIYGNTGLTNLNWYDARDPRPDYYRYLPSFEYLRGENERGDQLRNLWLTDVNTRQINWDNLYNANYNNLYTAQNVGGIQGNNETGRRAKYILENNVNRIQSFTINAALSHKISDKLTFSAAAYGVTMKDNYFKRMEDLLGADFWIDIDQFSERDFNDLNIAQNDLDNPNRLIRQGDKFGFDYIINVNRLETFGQIEYQNRKWELFLSGTVSQTTFWRDGKLRNGRFPEESFGESKRANFLNGGIKGGAVYKINGRNYITSNFMLMNRAPLPRTAFISPRNRNLMVENLGNEEIRSIDLNYMMRYSRLRARATVFYTELNNQVWNRMFYHDEFRTLINYTLNGVNSSFTGTEIGLAYNATSTITVNAALGTGQYIFNSRPTATITRDNAAELLAADRTVYLKNYRIGGMPQTAASIGLRYSAPKFWFAGFNLNFYDHIYVEANPDRRTAEALEKYTVEDPQWDQMIKQERLKSAMIMDVFFGKSWKVKKYFVNLNFNINNLFNNQDFRIGGFEQLRYDSDQLDRFPNRYSYHFGLTYFLMLSLRM